ncbi:MAG TPA: hypothetical protein PLY97_09680 [Acidocella sp.]|nr:MAG: hypothetical protein B7Z81_13130 [Acidocella sp. 20-61-6]HQT47479.1 hypothetical protein [Acidocella sp.]
MTHAINLIIFIILSLANLILAVVGFFDGLLAAVMSTLGIPPNAQLILLAVAAVLLIVYAVRALGRIFAALIIVLLVLLMLARVFPHMTVPHGHVPSWLTPHTQL